jgi:hypothetical protein
MCEERPCKRFVSDNGVTATADLTCVDNLHVAE